jgi:hypothetical protein
VLARGGSTTAGAVVTGRRSGAGLGLQLRDLGGTLTDGCCGAHSHTGSQLQSSPDLELLFSMCLGSLQV